MQGASFPSFLQVTEHTISDVSSAARSWELDSWDSEDFLGYTKICFMEGREGAFIPPTHWE